MVIACFGNVDAIQRPFARHNELRAADSSDCYLGSEANGWRNMFRDPHSLEDPLQFHPWGEALNPGPADLAADLLWIGFSNPSGLRNKEEIALSLGRGIWSFSETHLSAVTQKTCSRRLASLAAQEHRQLRVLMGAPVAFRAGSSWAGTWSGVATIADVPSRELSLPFAEERSCGRLLATSHYVAGLAITNVTVYGYPAGPTWPRHKSLTNELLKIVTTEVIYGGHGPRLVGGDFNASSQDLEVFALWRQMGWRSAQEYAEQMWGQSVQFTCKHATERDLIWMSPELQALCRKVDISDFFAEHSTISVGIQCCLEVPKVLAWPLPARIPWDLVSDTWTDVAVAPAWNYQGNADEQWAQLGASLEKSLQGMIPSQPKASLLRAQTGRLQRTKPVLKPAGPSLLRPSRPSEVALRNDLIGSEVKAWFRQLRKLQSYRAAIRAGKNTNEAIHHRLLLWSSIRQSPGFTGGFEHWWQFERTHTLPDTPARLPSAPPPVQMAEILFDTFKLCYDSFESWHLRQRCKLLTAKYEKGMKGLFQDLKKPTRDQLDFLIQSEDVGVLAVSDDLSQLHLEKPLDAPFDVIKINEEMVKPRKVEGDLLTLAQPLTCEIGDVVTCSKIVTDTSALHTALLDYWKPKWSLIPQICDADWNRILQFNAAYLPKLQIHAPPISIPLWKRALKRYKATAARGVDGISHLDLLHMPDAWTERLLELLHAIEKEEMPWPSALLYGVVNVLAKDVNATRVDRFRPVVIFSIVYRTWSSIRARQLLVQTAPHLESTMYGFVPNCETSQLWMALQGEIECSLQDGKDLCGLSTDLVQAFNYIPRCHSFQLAKQLGVPDNVLHAWSSFLGNCSRAFNVRNSLSDTASSTAGMPEGDAMSVFAMVQLGFAFHRYMKVLCPSVTAYSYVDNLTLTAAHPFMLSIGINGLKEFFRLWNMSIDDNKTYCWTTCPKFKRMLQLVQFKREDAAKELGGVLSFTKKQFTGLPVQRTKQGDATWTQLKASRAPMCQKLASLFIKFWPSLLYGSHAAGLGQQHVDHLRSAAMKALRLNKAGVNGRLRLSLSRNPDADPGFWRLHQAVMNFRRLVRKEPHFWSLWHLFMSNFDGKLFSGPFSQLVNLGNQIGWSFHPPHFLDHDGHSHHILHLDDAALFDLLVDGWYQHIAATVIHRNTMANLCGLDTALLRSKVSKLNSLDTALVGALNAGAFMSQSSQSKFDLTKQKDCEHCNVPDTQLHWLECPKNEPVKGSISGWVDRHWGDTDALRAHLLPSRSPWTVKWKLCLQQVADSSGLFESQPGPGIQHLFSDGSAGGNSPFQYAGWGCINATTRQVVATGHVTGCSQTSDRAELLAALSALKWTLHYQVISHLWLDSQFVKSGLDHVLLHGEAGNWSNLDLWWQIEDLLSQTFEDQFVPHWNPSHLADEAMEDAFEDWVRFWNNRADALAGSTNRQRSADFWRLHHAASLHHEQMSNRWDQLCQFYCKVASRSAETNAESFEPAGSQSLTHFDFVDPAQHSFDSLYSSDWNALIQDSGWSHPWIPGQFVVSICEWISGRVDQTAEVYPLSFLELALLLTREPDFLFPFQTPHSSGMVMSTLCRRMERPTLTYVLRIVKAVLVSFLDGIGCDDVVFKHHNKVALGVTMPVPGIFVRWTNQCIADGHTVMHEFTATRPIRKANDVARPV